MTSVACRRISLCETNWNEIEFHHHSSSELQVMLGSVYSEFFRVSETSTLKMFWILEMMKSLTNSSNYTVEAEKICRRRHHHLWNTSLLICRSVRELTKCWVLTTDDDMMLLEIPKRKLPAEAFPQHPTDPSFISLIWNYNQIINSILLRYFFRPCLASHLDRATSRNSYVAHKARETEAG